VVFAINPQERLTVGLIFAGAVLGGSLVVIVLYQVVKNSMKFGDSGGRADSETGRDSNDGDSGWGDGDGGDGGE